MEKDDLKDLDSVDDAINDYGVDIIEETELDLEKLTIEQGFEVIEGYPSLEVGQSPDHCFLYLKSWKNKEDMTIHDILKYHTLQFLPAKTLCRFRSVCKDWNNWIVNPFLAHLQSCYFQGISGLFCQIPNKKPFFISLDRSTYGVPSGTLNFLPETVTIRATCNGLLCCESHFNEDTNYYICNPANKEWKLLPKPKLYHGPGSAVGLAFKPSVLNFTPHFELVCAIPLTDSPVIIFEIYSSRSNSWRVAETQCWDPDALILNGDGFFLNGVIFWVTKFGAILAFHLKDEQYSMLPLPPSNRFQGALTAMQGEFCYIRPHIAGKDEDEGVQFTMEIYGDLNMTLKHKIPVSAERLSFDAVVGTLRALPCVNDDVLMLLVGKKLCAYHVKERKFEVIRKTVKAGQDEDVKLLPYVNSLVSLNMIGGSE